MRGLSKSDYEFLKSFMIGVGDLPDSTEEEEPLLERLCQEGRLEYIKYEPGDELENEYEGGWRITKSGEEALRLYELLLEKMES